MRRTRQVVFWSLLGVVLCAAFLALLLPGLVRDRINTKLAHMKLGYAGHVERVSFDWLARRVILHEFQIERPSHKLGAPFLTAGRLEVDLRFRGPLEPRLGLRFVKARINLIDGPKPADQQWGPRITLAELRRKLPVDLAFVELDDCQFHWRVFKAEPQVDVYLQDIDAHASPLERCIQESPQGCQAEIELKARAMADASLRAHGEMSYDTQFRLDLTASLRDLSLDPLNGALVYYGDFDVRAGELDADARFRMRGSRYQLVLEPDLQNFEAIGRSHAQARLGREIAVATLGNIIERRDERWDLVIHGVRGQGGSQWELARRNAR